MSPRPYNKYGIESSLLSSRLSIGETAVLRVDAKKVAKLIFNDDEEYFVEGIFSYPS